MEPLFVLIAGIMSVVAMFIITKIIGYREISQLSMFDYINGITLGSIAADLAISTEWKEALYCMIGMVVYGMFTFLFSLVSRKSLMVRNLLVGKPILLMRKGKLFRNSFKKARLDLDEFLIMCRGKGYFDLNKIDTVLMEANGQISIIPKAKSRPLTPEDINVLVDEEGLVANVVVDGHIMYSNLKQIGNNKEWLISQLKSLGVDDVSQVFLAICDQNNKLTAYLKLDTKKENIL